MNSAARRPALACRLWFSAALCVATTTAGAAPPVDCPALEERAVAEGVHIPGYMAIHEVTGKGRLQFYSGPDPRCVMPGVFILPQEEVIAYIEFQGYTSVMYFKRDGSDQVMGWVESSRLHPTGKGIAPRQD